MPTTLPKAFIKSTARDVLRKTQSVDKKQGELAALTAAAAALRKVLTDNGMTDAEIDGVITEIKTEDAAEAKKRESEPKKAKPAATPKAA